MNPWHPTVAIIGLSHLTLKTGLTEEAASRVVTRP